MSVAVVTDSTAYLPEGFAQRRQIRVVPLHVHFDDRTGDDGVDLGPAELATALTQHRMVTTSRPSPAEFAKVFRQVLDDGAEEIVSIHLSRELSGTWESARLAAEEVSAERVRVVDSRSAGMGLGFAVLAAAAAAEAGADGREVERVAAETASRTKTFFCLETLDYLRRGGRIGPAAALLGTALSVKPLLHVSDGRVVPLEKVRTATRALSRLVDLTVAAAGTGTVGIAVHHLATPDRAAELATRLDERLPADEGCLISEVGAVIGAHTGPGTIGVVVLPGGLTPGIG